MPNALKIDNGEILQGDWWCCKEKKANYKGTMFDSWSFIILTRLSPLSWSILYWCTQNKYPKGRYLSGTKGSLLCLRNCSAMLTSIFKDSASKDCLVRTKSGPCVLIAALISHFFFSQQYWSEHPAVGFKEGFNRRSLMGCCSETTSAVIMPINRPEVVNAKDSSGGRMLCLFDKWTLACFYEGI